MKTRSWSIAHIESCFRTAAIGKQPASLGYHPPRPPGRRSDRRLSKSEAGRQRCQGEPNFPQVRELKIPHPVHASVSSLDETLPPHVTVHELAISPPVLWEEQRERIGVVGDGRQD